MECPSTYYFVLAAFHLSFIINPVFFGQAVESPEYTPIQQESDFEIRIYKNISWMSAPVVKGTNFQKSTTAGFHRLYQYIHGANLNHTRLAMTAPVLTTITEASYFVKLSLSASYEGSPPQPDPELNLQVEKWREKCIAIRKFSGFARDDNIHEEAEALRTSLNEHWNVTLENKGSYTIAQYNASSHLSGRFNEVWMVVSGFGAEGCSNHGHDQGKN